MENQELENELELRMYFFVPYNISPIQQGIQSGHAMGNYALTYGRNNPTHIIWDFLEIHKTWIILNGGTTNHERDFESIPVGNLNKIADLLLDKDIEFSYFIEPDLNQALSAVCFIADERVFNKKGYPDFIDYILDVKMYDEAKMKTLMESPDLWKNLRETPLDELKEMFPEYYKEWVRFVGGVKNVFLRELLRGKKLA